MCVCLCHHKVQPICCECMFCASERRLTSVTLHAAAARSREYNETSPALIHTYPEHGPLSLEDDRVGGGGRVVGEGRESACTLPVTRQPSLGEGTF